MYVDTLCRVEIIPVDGTSRLHNSDNRVEWPVVVRMVRKVRMPCIE